MRAASSSKGRSIAAPADCLEGPSHHYPSRLNKSHTCHSHCKQDFVGCNSLSSYSGVVCTRHTGASGICRECLLRISEPSRSFTGIRAISTLAHKTVGKRSLSFWLVKLDDPPCYVLVGEIYFCVNYDSYRGNSRPSRALGR